MGVLWFGGHLYTLQRENEIVEAVFTEQGVIKALGSYEKVYYDYKDRIKHEVNLQGKTMLPGFVDSHLHIIGHGQKMIRLDLSQMKSAEEVKSALKNRTANLAKGEWLIGEGWNENQWKDPVIIHKSELDEICPEHPIMLTRICRHALVANSKAMALAGIDRHTQDPESGIIVKEENGDPTGYFHDSAQDLIKTVLPEVTESYLENVIRIAVKDLLAKGLVGGHSEDLFYYGGFHKTLDAYNRAVNEEHKFKAHLLVHHEVMGDMEDAGLGYLSGTDYVELGAIKIFSDGAFGGRTAWLTEEYSDEPGNRGVPMHTRKGLESIVKRARKINMPVAVHAIGDQAIEEVIHVLLKHPHKGRGRDRVIHGQLLKKETLDLLKKLNVVIDIQPTFVASDFPWVVERIGEQRMPLAYAWKTMLNNNIRCSGGSDAPVEQVEPLIGIEAAVCRKSTIDGKVYNEKEQLSVFEAIQLYTAGSAFAIGQESTRGVIKENYQADFTILEQDIFKVKHEEIHNIPVAMTVVDGEIVYKKGK